MKGVKEKKSLSQTAEITNMLGHQVRLKIIQFLYRYKEASWSQLANELEKKFGKMNPNTISFHLTKLMQGGIVERKSSDLYVITESASVDPVVKTIVDQIKENNNATDD